MKLKRQNNISRKQLEIIFGSILGDAYVTKQGQIQFEQSASQKAYLFWKYRELSSISYSNPPKLVVRTDKRNGRKTYSWRFWTRGYFRNLRNDFYPDGYKIFPKNLSLTDLSLAVWYMDDGWTESGRYFISVQGFSQEYKNRILKMLEEKFGILATIKERGHLKIRSQSIPRFIQTIKPHIYGSLFYKLPLDPVTTDPLPLLVTVRQEIHKNLSLLSHAEPLILNQGGGIV